YVATRLASSNNDRAAKHVHPATKFETARSVWRELRHHRNIKRQWHIDIVRRDQNFGAAAIGILADESQSCRDSSLQPDRQRSITFRIHEYRSLLQSGCFTSSLSLYSSCAISISGIVRKHWPDFFIKLIFVHDAF